MLTVKMKDPVCGMDVAPEAATNSTKLKGEAYYFCSGACKAKFDSNPNAFLDKKMDQNEGNRDKVEQKT